MPSKYTCYVPIEWHNYGEKFLINEVRSKAINQWREHQRLEGTTIRLGNVTAKLSHAGYFLWMRKSCDQSDYPIKNKYFGITMDCILCSKS